jgi:murein DD-endopeptidase MepM/ murein hydrolase activator NlpD
MSRPAPGRALVAAAVLALVLVPAASARLDDGAPADHVVAAAAALALSDAPFELRMPAFGEVTSRFGPRWGRMHHGIDIGMLTKLGVVAAAPGTVKETGYLARYEGYGKTIVLDHGDGLETLYAHLSTIRVQPGDRVEAGDWIGNAGCTGWCTGTHLHFELRERGTAVDPLPFLAEPSL